MTHCTSLPCLATLVLSLSLQSGQAPLQPLQLHLLLLDLLTCCRGACLRLRELLLQQGCLLRTQLQLLLILQGCQQVMLPFVSPQEYLAG